MVHCAVVILNWNGVSMLRDYLPHLVLHTPSDEGIELVVADNASTDDSLTFVQENYPQIRCIEMPKNRGFAGGYNEALKQIEAKYYVLLNSDVEVTENWLSPLLELMDSNPHVWACAPKLLDLKKRNYFEYAGASGGFVDQLGYPYCRGRIFDTLEEDLGQYDDSCSVLWATGAALMIRSEAFHALQGFDEDYFAHMEEIDLCWRIWHRGGEVRIVPQSKVFHLGGATLNSSSPQKTYLNFRNNLATLYKNELRSRVWFLLLVRVALDVLAAFVFLAKGQKAQAQAALRGHWHFWKNITSLRAKRKDNKAKCLKRNPPGILKYSIIWCYQVLKRRRFSEL